MKKINSFIVAILLISFQAISAAAPKASWGKCLRRQLAQLLQGATPQAATPIDPQQAEEDLIDAAMKGNVAKVQQLLDAGVNVDVSLYGGTALMHAAGQQHKDMVEMLLDAEADVNATNQMGTTALYMAFAGEFWPSEYHLSDERKAIVDMLLQAGADKDKAEQRARAGGKQGIADFIRDYEPLGGLTKSARKR